MVKNFLAALAAMFALSACAARLSTHPVTPADLGAPVSTAQMLEALKQPGSIAFEQVVAADWTWSEAFATPGVEPPDWQNAPLVGQVYFYKLRHPTRGLILIDTGLPADTPRYLGAVVRNVFDIDNTFTQRLSSAEALGGAQPSAVLLTHLHWDHVLGARELPREVPLYVGPGDGAMRHFLLRFIAPATRRALEGRGPLREWRFSADPDERTAGVIDVFGDGSIFAIRAPGHTPGSTAYIVNAIDGVHLITGDAIHSAAGWRGERVEYHHLRSRPNARLGNAGAIAGAGACDTGNYCTPGASGVGGARARSAKHEPNCEVTYASEPAPALSQALKPPLRRHPPHRLLKPTPRDRCGDP